VAQARDIIRASGVDAGIVLDVLHLVRMGGTAADVRGLEPGLIRHVQVCDGVASPTPEALRVEATYERMYPGEGVFPLVELLRDAPTDVSWGIEAPSRRRVAVGMTAESQAMEAMAAVRRLIGQLSART
jgi:sugar phosphate isomerase/epimerase